MLLASLVVSLLNVCCLAMAKRNIALNNIFISQVCMCVWNTAVEVDIRCICGFFPYFFGLLSFTEKEAKENENEAQKNVSETKW